MLSIGQASAGYYINLAKDDYYHKGTEPAGLWYGRGAEQLGLSGRVGREDFLTLCDGFNPKEQNEKFVQNAGKENRRAGWDLTFSAPKTVSALWATADEEMRQRISAAHYSAVMNTLDYLQEHYGFTRVGQSGREVEKTDKLFFSLFEHSTSREQDPQLHIHAVLVNVGMNGRDETKTLEVNRIFAAKLEMGALYKAELAYQLRQELGLEIERAKKGAFEITGDFKGLDGEWSKRRAEIKKAMEKEGAQGAERAAYFTLKTRNKKENISREELFQKWGQEARAAGFDYRELIHQKEFEPGSGGKRLADAMPSVFAELTESKAYFNQFDFVRKVAEFAPLCDANMKDVREVAERYLKREAIHLRTVDDKGIEKRIYTTKEIDALEKRMLEQVRDANGRDFAPVNKNVDYTISKVLSDEQRQALYHICESEGALKVVSGMAGTGKTTLLSSANDVWKAKGFEVKGAALAAVAAKGLEEEAGIESKTVARLLLDIERAEKNGEKKPVHERTVLVVDEAGMIGTRQMARLVEVVEREKAKLVLIGDEKQLQPIEHGAPFKAIGEIAGKQELKDIKRQREEWARDAVHSVARGESEKALSAFAQKGMLQIEKTREDAIKGLINLWRDDAGDIKEKLILSTTRHGARALNELAQEQRREAGELRGDGLQVNGYCFYAGDRVLFTKNNKALGVMNGQAATVLTINPNAKTVGVLTDSGERKIISTSIYESLELGYATTTHKAQGKTVDKAYVLAGGVMQDKELSYVQVSRAREATRIFTSVEEGGRSVQELAAKMNQSRQKAIAQEMREEYRQEIQQEQERKLSLSR